MIIQAKWSMMMRSGSLCLKRWNFELRKRKELEELIKLNMRVKKTSSNLLPKLLAAGSHSKEKGLKDSVETSNPLHTPSKSVKSTKEVVGSSYIQSAGKTLICPEILTIEELLDLPIPIFSKDSIQRTYYGSDTVPIGRSFYQVDQYGGDPHGRFPRSQRMSLEKYEDEDTLGKRFGSRIVFDDILRGLTKKLVSWNQFIFNQKTFDHLKQRPFLFDHDH